SCCVLEVHVKELVLKNPFRCCFDLRGSLSGPDRYESHAASDHYCAYVGEVYVDHAWLGYGPDKASYCLCKDRVRKRERLVHRKVRHQLDQHVVVKYYDAVAVLPELLD